MSAKSYETGCRSPRVLPGYIAPGAHSRAPGIRLQCRSGWPRWQCACRSTSTGSAPRLPPQSQYATYRPRRWSAKRSWRNEGLGKSRSLLAEGEQWNAGQGGGETSCCRLWVASLGFLHDGRGNKQVKACPLCVPPLLGNLLVCRSDEVTTWPCGEITDDGCFKVDFWLHGWTLYNLGLGVKILPHARWAERQA